MLIEVEVSWIATVDDGSDTCGSGTFYYDYTKPRALGEEVIKFIEELRDWKVRRLIVYTEQAIPKDAPPVIIYGWQT